MPTNQTATIAKRARRGKGQSTGRPRTLTSEQITEAAVAVIDEFGPQSLSLQKVAARLGVRASTLYTYFDSLEALADAAQAQLLRELPRPREGSPLRDQLLGLFVGLRQLYLRHPGLMNSMLGGAAWREKMRFTAAWIEFMAQAGLDAEQAYLLLRAGEGASLSSVQLEQKLGGGDYVAIQREALMQFAAEGEESLGVLTALPYTNLSPDAGFHRLIEQLLSQFFGGQLKETR